MSVLLQTQNSNRPVLRTLVVDNESSSVQTLRAQLQAMSGVEIVSDASGGLEALEMIRQLSQSPSSPVVIVVAANEKGAVTASELRASGDPLKPEPPATLSAPRKIVGRSGQEYFFLSADEVFAFQAEGDLVWILTARKKYYATQTLREIELRMKNLNFCRIHRGAVVNLDHVKKMSSLSSQRWLLTLENNVEFVVSKRQARIMRELLT